MASVSKLSISPRNVVPLRPLNEDSPVETSQALSQAILSLYEGLMEPVRWQQALDLLAAYLNASSVTLVVRPSTPDDPGFLMNSRSQDAIGQPAHVGAAMREEIVSRYSSYYYQIDPFRELPLERIVDADEMLGTEAWLNSPFYKEVIEKVNVRYMMGVNMVTRAGTVCRLRISRMTDKGAFSSEDKQRLALFVPHFKQAITLAHQLDRNETERALYEGALDRLNIATIVLDETGRVLRNNSAASKLLQAGDGLRLVNRKVETRSEAETEKLQQLIAQSLADDGRRVHAMSAMRLTSDHRLGIVLRGVPLRENSEGKERPATVLFVRDPDALTATPRDILRRVFDFTPAEALLAIELANGLSLDEAAEALNIRRNTARAQLRSIFVKAGVGRQSELVRILLNGVIGLTD